jgi:hypothetical protein
VPPTHQVTPEPVAPGPSPGHRCRGDAGTGLVANIASVAVFLTFLLFAVQLLVGLYARSMVSGVAYDGARSVAGFRTTDRARAEQQAEERMRQQLGRLAVRFDWGAGTDDTIVLRVWADSPRFLLPGFAGPLATDHIDRQVSVRVERPR